MNPLCINLPPCTGEIVLRDNVVVKLIENRNKLTTFHLSRSVDKKVKKIKHQFVLHLYCSCFRKLPSLKDEQKLPRSLLNICKLFAKHYSEIPPGSWANALEDVKVIESNRIPISVVYKEERVVIQGCSLVHK